MNLEKQIKRHIIGRRQRFYAVSSPGLETPCARELAGLSDTIRLESSEKGGIAFSGRLEDLYRANLHLRTAGRILMRLTEFEATNFRQLARKAAEVAWARYLPAGVLPGFKVSARRSRLYHSQAIAQAVQQGLWAYWQDLSVEPQNNKSQTLYIRLDQDAVLLSLDSSGANLHRRGLKTHAAAAPLRETLAAAILQLAGYDPERPLLDPMCGSGTFTLEAALMAKQIPPGHARAFAFMQWPSFRPARWRYLKDAAAKEMKRIDQPLIHASDIEPETSRSLADCIRRNGLQDAVTVRSADFFSFSAPLGPCGLIVLNPPYGRRLASEAHPEKFYGRIWEKLSRDFSGWRIAWIVPRPEWVPRMARHIKPLNLVHGGLKLTLLIGRI